MKYVRFLIILFALWLTQPYATGKPTRFRGQRAADYGIWLFIRHTIPSLSVEYQARG